MNIEICNYYENSRGERVFVFGILPASILPLKHPVSAVVLETGETYSLTLNGKYSDFTENHELDLVKLIGKTLPSNPLEIKVGCFYKTIDIYQKCNLSYCLYNMPECIDTKGYSYWNITISKNLQWIMDRVNINGTPIHSAPYKFIEYLGEGELTKENIDLMWSKINEIK